MTTRLARFIGVGALALAVTATAATASAQAPTEQVGTVRVVHGLRGLVADVYLDGNLALPTFQPERATDPIAIPAGDHVVEIRAAGAAATETPLLTQTVTVPAGFAGSLIAHLGADGAPTLTAYADDVSAVPAGQARVVVRHAAAAGDVAVQLNGQPTVPALAPVAESASIVAAGPYQVAVTPAAGGAPLATPQDVAFAEGTATFMYLIGSQADGTLGWAAVEVEDLQTAPAMIQTGDGSTLTDESGPNPYAIGAVIATLVAALAATFAVRSRRTGP
jgi:hypothetical protein